MTTRLNQKLENSYSLHNVFRNVADTRLEICYQMLFLFQNRLGIHEVVEQLNLCHQPLCFACNYDVN